MRKRVVLAIGGNSLIRAKDKQSFADQMVAVTETCRQIADLVESGHEVVVTHGNGPQVGFLLIRSHLSRNRLPETPLDAANAQTQAEIGYMIQQALGNELNRRGLSQGKSEARCEKGGAEEGDEGGVKGVVTVITQVVVDSADPAFQNPSKPVGPFYTKAEAAGLQREEGWAMREDGGRGFRRLVPSPRPIEVVEQREIEELLEAGFVVVACGGGGIPVVRDRTSQKPEVGSQNAEHGNRTADGGEMRGVAAVIDKDLASSLLARELEADILVISTAVEQVYVNFGRPNQRALSDVKVSEMRRYLAEGQFPEGSMGPKVEAALEFLEGMPNAECRVPNTGTGKGLKPGQSAEGKVQSAECRAGGSRRLVVITDPEHITAAMKGQAGTRIVS